MEKRKKVRAALQPATHKLARSFVQSSAFLCITARAYLLLVVGVPEVGDLCARLVLQPLLPDQIVQFPRPREAEAAAGAGAATGAAAQTPAVPRGENRARGRSKGPQQQRGRRRPKPQPHRRPRRTICRCFDRRRRSQPRGGGPPQQRDCDRRRSHGWSVGLVIWVYVCT